MRIKLLIININHNEINNIISYDIIHFVVKFHLMLIYHQI